MCRLSWNLGASNSWNLLGLSTPVMGLLYLLPFTFYVPQFTNGYSKHQFLISDILQSSAFYCTNQLYILTKNYIIFSTVELFRHILINMLVNTCNRIFFFVATARKWARASSFTRFLDHTQRLTTVGRIPLDEWSARRRDLCLTTRNTHNRWTSIPPVAFEPTISAGEWPQTHALDPEATEIDVIELHPKKQTPFFWHFNIQRCSKWLSGF